MNSNYFQAVQVIACYPKNVDATITFAQRQP